MHARTLPYAQSHANAPAHPQTNRYTHALPLSPSSLGWQVVEDGGNVKIRSANAGKDFAPEEISAQVRGRG